jgi:hypothetical protein
MKNVIIGVGGVILVVGLVTGYSVYRRDVITVTADLHRLQRANHELADHQRTLDNTGSAFQNVSKSASAAGQRRHDNVISRHPDVSFDADQADIEKTDVTKLGDLVETMRKEHAEKTAILQEIYGLDAVSQYRDCTSTSDEAWGNFVGDWYQAIESIDDDDHIILNGGEHSDSVDTISANFYNSSAKAGEAAVSAQVRCAAAYEVLTNRLNADIQAKKQSLARLGVHA